MTHTPLGPDTHRRPYYWEELAAEWSGPRRTPQGAGVPAPAWHLRALREGLGAEPGTVAGMRYLHRVELTDAARGSDRLPRSYQAEHAALTLFGLHQQGAPQLVHQPGLGLGTVCRVLRAHQNAQTSAPPPPRGERSADGPVARRLTAAATAVDLDELVHHVRALIPLLRQAGIGLDYTRLHRDLCDWLTPRHGRVLRAWGLQFTDPADDNGQSTAGTEKVQPGFWDGFDPADADAGAVLAALRSGLGEEAGTVPVVWGFYRTTMGSDLRVRGALTRDLIAEHAALSLFGLHQQGRQQSVHTPGVSPGTACRLLLARDHGISQAAVEERLGVLLTSVDMGELAHHLRSLMPLLRKAEIGLDYDLLRRALRNWDDPQRSDVQPKLRSSWDRDFHRKDPSA
ncbi:type I-E CRISPR-associated protein Cse2/CasB [Streptomyces sp. NPDC026659]|uniref:type I-E CRISPR-associated protein Cse2/CasB n=1 Tax=Streptomyces sp. NPDC026659 TaxID=3155123 RepID=UPI0033EA50B6